MSEQVVLWLFGGLIAALGTLIGIVYRNLVARINELDSGALAQFIAKDSQRETDWLRWREIVDERGRGFGSDIKKLEHRVTRLERNGGPHPD